MLRRADLSNDRPHAVSHRVPHHQMVTLAGHGNLTVVSSVFWGYDRGALQEGLDCYITTYLLRRCKCKPRRSQTSSMAASRQCVSSADKRARAPFG